MNPYTDAAADELGLNSIEALFDSLGLRTPLLRASAGWAVTSAALSYMKPGMMYDPNGEPLPWSVTNMNPQIDSTMVPWWLPGIAIGGVFGLFF
jgi:hypothetical protein